MGAQPVFALNIVEFPVKTLPLSILEEILKGGSDKTQEAGVSIAGGHSVEDNAPKYGMAVTGFIDPLKLITNKGAKPGDVLFLTKPLGIGILTTALDRGLAGREVEQEIYKIMAHLNRGAAEAMVAVGVHACTDVTGFGLLGHLYEMMSASKLSAQIVVDHVPVLAEAKKQVKSGAIPAGTHNNFRYLLNKVKTEKEISHDSMMLLCDAQTSGGLLIAVQEEKADQLQAELIKAGCLVAAVIGKVTEQKEKAIELLS
jgi:selenide,water dikinase